MSGIRFKKCLFGFRPKQVMQVIAQMQQEAMQEREALAVRLEEEKQALISAHQQTVQQLEEQVQTVQEQYTQAALSLKQTQNQLYEVQVQEEAKIEAVRQEYRDQVASLQQERDEANRGYDLLMLKEKVNAQQVEAMNRSYEVLSDKYSDLRKKYGHDIAGMEKEKESLNDYINTLYNRNKELLQRSAYLEEQLASLEKTSVLTQASMIQDQGQDPDADPHLTQDRDFSDAIARSAGDVHAAHSAADAPDTADRMLERIRGEILDAMETMMKKITQEKSTPAAGTPEEKNASGVVYKLGES